MASPKRQKTPNDNEAEHSNKKDGVSLDQIINIGIPDVGEQIFKSLDDYDLIQGLGVSRTWKDLAENVLTKRWRAQEARKLEKYPSIASRLLDPALIATLNFHQYVVNAHMASAMEAMRPVVQAESTLKGSAAINQFLGRRVSPLVFIF